MNLWVIEYFEGGGWTPTHSKIQVYRTRADARDILKYLKRTHPDEKIRVKKYEREVQNEFSKSKSNK